MACRVVSLGKVPHLVGTEAADQTPRAPPDSGDRCSGEETGSATAPARFRSDGSVSTATCPSVTSTCTATGAKRTLNAVPTARTSTVPADTTKGRAGSLATAKWASPVSKRTRRPVGEYSTARSAPALRSTTDPSGRVRVAVARLSWQYSSLPAATASRFPNRGGRRPPGPPRRPARQKPTPPAASTFFRGLVLPPRRRTRAAAVRGPGFSPAGSGRSVPVPPRPVRQNVGDPPAASVRVPRGPPTPGPRPDAPPNARRFPPTLPDACSQAFPFLSAAVAQEGDALLHGPRHLHPDGLLGQAQPRRNLPI